MSAPRERRLVGEEQWKPWLFEFLLYDLKASAVTSVGVKIKFLMIWESEGLYMRRRGSLIYLSPFGETQRWSTKPIGQSKSILHDAKKQGYWQPIPSYLAIAGPNTVECGITHAETGLGEDQ